MLMIILIDHAGEAPVLVYGNPERAPSPKRGVQPFASWLFKTTLNT